MPNTKGIDGYGSLKIPYPNFPFLVHQSGCTPLSCQGISDGIVQLLQPNVATARKLLLVQYERQGAVCQLYFQLFPVKAKPCHRSTVSASVFVRPPHTDINIHWHGLESALLHGLSDGLQGVALHVVKDSPDGLGRGNS